jgi:hypothetical protein
VSVGPPWSAMQHSQHSPSSITRLKAGQNTRPASSLTGSGGKPFSITLSQRLSFRVHGKRTWAIVQEHLNVSARTYPRAFLFVERDELNKFNLAYAQIYHRVGRKNMARMDDEEC